MHIFIFKSHIVHVCNNHTKDKLDQMRTDHENRTCSKFYLSDSRVTSYYTNDISISMDKLQSKHLFTALPTQTCLPLTSIWSTSTGKKV